MNSSTASVSELPGDVVVSNVPSAPEPPDQLDNVDVEPQVLYELALRAASTVPQFTTEWASAQLCLPVQVVEEIFWQHKRDHLVEIRGQEGPFNYRYAITDKGMESARRLFEFCGYIGPAPVSLASYSNMLNDDTRTQVRMESVQTALRPLTVPDTVTHVAALAAASGRSLFLFGPAGNGKTTLGKLLHGVNREGTIWIPHAISVGSTVIRIYDEECHESVPVDEEGKWDRRWMRIKRPFIIAGGEMTIAELDLSYSHSHRFYEAPPHVKANGGTFMIDDFGRQRVDPSDLLNRWIIPLEHQVDHLTLHTGQKIQMPFKLMLTVATNLNVNEVADPAFLRRMGYRVHLPAPDEDRYREIFSDYAALLDIEVPEGLVDRILTRYQQEQRELRGSEPRELMLRCRDICELRQQPFALSEEIMDLAWVAFFGTSCPSVA